jgi:hypothetical protein
MSTPDTAKRPFKFSKLKLTSWIFLHLWSLDEISKLPFLFHNIAVISQVRKNNVILGTSK